MLQRYLIVWLLLLSVISLFWSRWVPGGPDPFVVSKPALPLLIAITMFAIGCMLPRDEVRQVIRRWPLVLSGTGLQYLAMPALAWLFAGVWGITGDHRIGLLMVGCVPGAMASNVLAFLARGNTSYSVSLTTSATLLSPLAVPLVLGIAAYGEAAVQFRQLIESGGRLLITVVIPVVAGHVLARRDPGISRIAARLGPLVANLAILWIIAVVVGLNRERLLDSTHGESNLRLLAALLSLNLGGYLVGYAGGSAAGLPEAMRRALTLEIGMQNAGLGATLAGQLFASDAIAMPPALYTFGCMMTGTLLAKAWSLRPPAAAER